MKFGKVLGSVGCCESLGLLRYKELKRQIKNMPAPGKVLLPQH